MSRPSFSADFRSAAPLDGEELPWFGGEEEDEADESALVESTAAYGSLVGLGGGRKKKAMALVLDPIEAENEARRVRHIAGQQFGCSDEPALLDESIEPPVFDEPEEIAAEAYEPEEPVADYPFAGEAPVAAEPEYAQAEAAPVAAETAREPDDFWVFSDDGADDLPDAEAPVESAPVATIAAIEAIAPDPLPEATLPPPPAQPAVESRPRHSLRARVPQHKQRRSLAQHLVAVIGWLAQRFARRGE